MKKYIHFVLSVSLAGTLTQACNEKELLEPLPVTSLSDLEAFKSPDRVLGQVHGLYASAKNGQLYGGRFPVYIDVRGEDFTNVSGNFVTAAFAYQHSQIASNTEVGNLWAQAYLTINRANVFLKGLDDNPSVVDATLADQYRGEARFIRAITYFALVNIYARPYVQDNGASPGVPLRLTAEQGADNNDLARSSVAEVYQQILADLDFAEQNLPASYETPLFNTTRAHTNTAIAFKTRVYLVMGQMDRVIAEARKIVSGTTTFSAPTGVPHALQPNIAQVFTQYTTPENIFSFPMSENDLPGIQNSLGSYYNPAISGDYAVSTDPGAIFNSPAWTATDARRTELTRSTTVGSSTRYWLKKFNTAPAPTDFVPVIRYSEVLLNYAEALVRSANAVSPLALSLLNAVRGRSAPDAVYTEAQLATAADFLNALYLERRIEFLGEGLRSIDLARLNLPLPAKGPSAVGSVGAVQPTAANYIWPIPQSEIVTNKLIEQNPQ